MAITSGYIDLNIIELLIEKTLSVIEFTYIVPTHYGHAPIMGNTTIDANEKTVPDSSR